MNMATEKPDLRQKVWDRYRNNLPRYLIGLSRYLQSQTMHTLTEQLGHKDLKLNFEPFFTLLGQEGCRPTELAEWLGVSKQSCNRTANQIKKAGYLEDKPDPSDGRAKILVVTDKGQKMIQEAYRVGVELESAFAQQLGEGGFAELRELLQSFYAQLQLPKLRLHEAAGEEGGILLGGLLPRLNEYISHRLMELTRAKGHFGLKMPHGQVLSLIGLSGGRIQQIAKIQDVSKQAISAVAKELDQLGYIRQSPDLDDARGVVLMFTDEGLNLLRDSVESIEDVEWELIQLLGSDGTRRLEQLSQQLYQNLRLEEEVFKADIAGLCSGAEKNLKSLAASLRQQLGGEGASALAHLLISPTTIDRKGKTGA